MVTYEKSTNVVESWSVISQRTIKPSSLIIQLDNALRLQNGQTHIKNIVAIAARILKCV